MGLESRQDNESQRSGRYCTAQRGYPRGHCGLHGEDLWVPRRLWTLWTWGGGSNNRLLVRKMGTVEVFEYIGVPMLYLWSFFSPFHSQGAHPLIILRIPHWPAELKRLTMEK